MLSLLRGLPVATLPAVLGAVCDPAGEPGGPQPAQLPPSSAPPGGLLGPPGPGPGPTLGPLPGPALPAARRQGTTASLTGLLGLSGLTDWFTGTLLLQTGLLGLSALTGALWSYTLVCWDSLVLLTGLQGLSGSDWFTGILRVLQPSFLGLFWSY